MTQPFSFARAPAIRFGGGTAAGLAEAVRELGPKALLVTGARSLDASGRLRSIVGGLEAEGISADRLAVEGEPSPELVDGAVARHRQGAIDVVVAIGGGSVIDAGKAVSAMLLESGSVVDYLEGLGTGAAHSGRKVPFIAVPTTAGTGSEATKNAVLSRPGRDGFKRSLRHDAFVPDLAIVDPELMLSCPAGVTAACGLDAFTQLLESYVSTRASALTDALAISGLESVAAGLVRAYAVGASDLEARARMAHAALLSGMTLANAGLGVVHGLAAPLGGRFDIPHGVICGTLVGAATRVTIRKLSRRHGWDHPALCRYAGAGALLGEREAGDTALGCESLTETIDGWIEELRIPRLGAYGVREPDLEPIAAAAGNKNNPVALEPAEIEEVLVERL